MDISEMNDKYLLFEYSNTLHQIDALYKRKREFEAEIAARNDFLKQQYQRGKIKLEKEEDE